MNRSNLFQRPFVVILLSCLCTLLWGSAFPCVKLGYELFQINGPASQILFAGLRFTLAGLLVLLWQFIRLRRVPLPTGAFPEVAALGIVQTSIQYCFFYIGLAHTTGMKGSILNGAGSFFALLLAHFAYRDDKLNLQKILGCAVGFAGVVTINWNSNTTQGGFSLLGEGFVLLAAAAFAVGFLLSRRATQKISAQTASGWQLFLGGMILIFFGIAGGGSIPNVSQQGVIMLLYLAFLSAVAFTVWSLLLQYNPVGKIAVFHFLTPIFGVLLSALLLGESLSGARDLLALVFVCTGIAIVNFHPHFRAQKA